MLGLFTCMRVCRGDNKFVDLEGVRILSARGCDTEIVVLRKFNLTWVLERSGIGAIFHIPCQSRNIHFRPL